jgi:hypothetical protein
MRHFGPLFATILAFSLPGCVAETADEPESPTGAAEEAQGGGNLQIATTSGLFVIDHPVSGEAAMVGMVLVMAGKSLPPADTVVTLNGVALARVPGLTPRYWQVDPAGPQPAVGADGFLHLAATSSAGNRTLNLPCPAAADVSADPPAGSSLGGVTSLNLSWTTPLPAYASTEASFGISPPAATLSGYDAGANALGAWVSSQVPSSFSVQLPVSATTSPGYLAELRYPGAYILDGNSGGTCGRAVRTTFLQ